MNKCLLCEREYQPIRSSSLFCSQKCRVNYHHIKNKAEKSGDKIEYLTTSSGIKMKITKEILVNELAKRGVQIPQQIPYQVFPSDKQETSQQIESVKYGKRENSVITFNNNELQKPSKTIPQYHKEIENSWDYPEDLKQLEKEINKDGNLTPAQKRDLLSSFISK